MKASAFAYARATSVANALELLVLESPELKGYREANRARLQGIKAHAASLRRLVDMTLPAADPDRPR